MDKQTTIFKIENRSLKIYTIEEIIMLSQEVFKKYKVKKAYIFGSYARGEATSNSDIDFMIRKGNLKSLFELGGLYYELENIFGKQIDIVTEESYTDEIEEMKKNTPNDSLIKINELFYEQIKQERILIYE